MAPQIIFGTASFGMTGTEFQDVNFVNRVLQNLAGLGIKRLDSAPATPRLVQGDQSSSSVRHEKGAKSLLLIQMS